MANCLISICKGLSRKIVIRIVALLVVVLILGGIVMIILNFTKSDEIIVKPEGLTSGEQYTKCKTRNDSLGVCREKHNCQKLYETLPSTQCVDGMLCCAAEPYTNPIENCTSSEESGCKSNRTSRFNNQTETFERVEQTCKTSSAPPEPESRCCGLKAVSNLRIIGGLASGIDEYPWTAALEYEKNGVSKVRCGGSLISGRYVLTAAHCVVGDKWTLKNVRLGDYNISNPGKDCVLTETGGTDCTDGEVIVPVQAATSHPGYNISTIHSKHDIALIRLDRIVNYTDFIRPICLPSVDFTKTSTMDVLYVVGWGSNKINSTTEIKVSVDLPYVPHKECQASYMSAEVEIGDGRLCAGGVRKKDSCAGDSGGPLMKKNGTRLELVGIVSFGLEECGQEGIPGVYTKVHSYISWIREHILD